MPAKIKLVFVIGFLLTCPCPIIGQDTSATARTEHEPVTPQLGKLTLRELAKARKQHIGTCVMPETNMGLKELLAKEFNLLVAESHMKWNKIHPEKGKFDWAFPDQLVEFAAESKLEVKGHALLWHGACPEYLQKLSAKELKAEVSNHIKTVVARYKRKIARWDVVNEALDDNGKGLRKSIFLDKLGPNYIAECFVMAHKADPSAILIYNDYGCEGMTSKADRQYELIKALLAKKIPIHEVGLQMHILGDFKVNPADLRKNVERLTQLGVKVNISEMDVAFNSLPGNSIEERLKVQANIYKEIVGACVDIPGFSGVTFWGYSDRSTWLNWLNRGNPNAERERPLLFDSDLQKKPAYFAVEEVLLIKNKKR